MKFFTTGTKVFGPTDEGAPGFEVASIDGPNFAARAFEPEDRGPHGAVYIHDAERIEISTAPKGDHVTLRVLGEFGATVSVFGITLADLAAAVAKAQDEVLS